MIVPARHVTLVFKRWLYFGIHFSAWLLLSILISKPLYAMPGNQDIKVSLYEKEASLDKIFKSIKRQTGYSFVYTEQQIRKSRKVWINVKDTPLEKALDLCFMDQPFSYAIVNRMVVVKEKGVELVRDPVVDLPVNGKVTNETGKPLAGATVNEKGTSNKVLVQDDGSFSINVANADATLIVTYVGYEPIEMKLKGQTTVSFSLVQSANSLNDVVVVGYGTSRRKDLTGSVASVGNKDIKDLGVSRVDQALLGKAPGVQVKPVSGEPGVAPQIRIRGIGSISAGAGPLYVVDGFPIASIETLNPNDIESMDVLKDASATAIYGSRGSGGVIIINTKKGRAGKTNISFDSYTGWQKVSKVPEMMNAKEQAQYFFDGIKNRNIDEGNNISGAPATWLRPVPALITDVIAGTNTTDEDALSAVLVTAPVKQYQLSASGGNENLRFFISGEYLDQDGIVLNSYFKRYSLRANIDAKLTKRLSLKVNVNPSFTTRSSLPVTGNQGENILGSAISTSNFYPLLDANGDYFFFGGLAAQADFYNPLAIANEYQAVQRQSRLLANVESEYKFTDHLNFRVLVGASILNAKGMTFKPQLPVFFNNPPSGTDNASSSYNWLTEYTLNYNRSFGKHHIVGLAGFTAQEERGDLNMLASNRYPNNLVSTLSAVSGIITSGTSESYIWSMNSYLARMNYDFNSKYYVTASIRTDGSSRFGSKNKYGVFPSAAIAWRISEENFLKDISFINDMKLRVSYGQTGNNNIGNYEQYATISYEKYPLGGVAMGAYAPARPSNPLLTWEKQKSFNVGLEVAVLNNRLRLTVDNFASRNTGLLLNVNVPSVTGFSNSLMNIGEVKNSGWEFAVSTQNLKGAFEWTTEINLSTYKNEVLSLGPEGDPIYAGNNKTMIGQPIGMFYGFLTDGIFKTQAELNQGPIYNPGSADRSRVGDIRFKDISGPAGKPDGVINSFDNTLIGSPYPDFYYGMTNRISYKNLSLTIGLQGSKGNLVYNNSRGAGNSTRARVRVYAFNNNYWKSEQDPGDGVTPRPNDAPSGGVRLSSERWLDDASYLRINNMTLAYLLPNTITSRLRVSALRFYISATNAFTFTKYATYNPDVSLNEDPLQPGNESNDYPLPKTLIIGLNLSF